MSDDLVERLRGHAEWGDVGPPANDPKLLKEAAARIEAQEAEIARLKADLRAVSKWYSEAASENAELQCLADHLESALANAVEVMRRQVDNACAACDVLPNGIHRIDATANEWDAHVAATEAARKFVKEHDKP